MFILRLRSDKLSILTRKIQSIANMIPNIKPKCRVLLRIRCAFTCVVLVHFLPSCKFVVLNNVSMEINDEIKKSGFESLVTSKRLPVLAFLSAFEEQFDVLVHNYRGKVPEEVFLKLRRNARIYSVANNSWRTK